MEPNSYLKYPNLNRKEVEARMTELTTLLISSSKSNLPWLLIQLEQNEAILNRDKDNDITFGTSIDESAGKLASLAIMYANIDQPTKHIWSDKDNDYLYFEIAIDDDLYTTEILPLQGIPLRPNLKKMFVAKPL